MFLSPELAQLTESVHVLRARGEAFIVAAGVELGGGFVSRGHGPHLPLGSTLGLLLLLGQLPLGHVQGEKSQSDAASCTQALSRSDCSPSPPITLNPKSDLVSRNRVKVGPPMSRRNKPKSP